MQADAAPAKSSAAPEPRPQSGFERSAAPAVAAPVEIDLDGLIRDERGVRLAPETED
jgi:hypothetical protein